MPNILIVCESPFSLDNGFGVTLTSLFANWPGSHLGLFYVNKGYKLQPRSLSCLSYAPVPGPTRRFELLPFKLGIRPEWRGKYSSAWLQKALRSFIPVIVYTFAHSFSTLRFGHWISKNISVPHVIHVGDDCLRSTVEAIEIVHHASGHLAISNEMAIQYSKCFDRSFNIFHNGASHEYYPPKATGPLSDKPTRVIRYLGSIYSWLHYQSLFLVREAVSNCRKQNINWQIEVFGNTNNEELRTSGLLADSLTYGGSVSRLQGIDLLQQADLLILPLSYDPQIVSSYRLSFPTKLAEYMATGVPILLLSDSSTASVSFCRQHNVCHVIDQPCVSSIEEFLSDLWFNPQKYAKHAQRNQSICRLFLDQDSISARFTQYLCSLA